MKMTIPRVAILSLVALIVFPTPAYAAEENVIAKSAFIHLADPETRQLDERHFAYLPAGTRIIKLDETVTYRGAKRHLILTESGLWGYIKEGLFWDKNSVDAFKESGPTVFIKRQIDVTVQISEELQLKVRFTRGETYRLIEEKETSFVIELAESDKLKTIAPDKSLPVSIPRDHANLVRFDPELGRDEVHFYELSIVDGIKGIRKPCNTTQVKASRARGAAGVGFDLTKFFSFLSAKGTVEASTETEKLEEFDKDINVTRTYFTRRGTGGIYRLTRYQNCSGATQYIHYVYTNPDNEELTINREWAESVGLKTDKRTGQVLVTCPPQYFAFKDELLARGFREDEVPFIISSVAKFKKVGTTCYEE
jgi:hypothetical protein